MQRLGWLLIGCAGSLGCANATTSRVVPEGPATSSRLTRTTGGERLSARLAPSGGGVRLRLVRSVPCEIVREDVQPTVEVHERTVSTAGWLWTGALALTGAVLLAADPKKSSRRDETEAGLAYLAGAGVLFGVAMGRSGQWVVPGPPITRLVSERRTTCPTTRADKVAVVVDVAGLVFDGVTDADGVVDVPMPIGDTPWRIKANGRIVDDVASE